MEIEEEPTQSDIKGTIEKAQGPKLMYEEIRLFNIEEIDLRNDESTTDKIINRMIKKEQLEKFQAGIQKKIYMECIEQVTLSVEEQLKGTHHFCYPQLVISDSSESTSKGETNNTKTITSATHNL